MARDPYTALGVPRGAASAEIKTAYRRRARSLHPDVNGSDPDAAEKFKELVAAYELLSDPLRRAAYDRDRDRPGGTPWDFRRVRDRPARWQAPRQPLQDWTASRAVWLNERVGRRRGRRGSDALLLHRVVMSPDLRRLATHRGDTVELWDPTSGRSVARSGREERGFSWLGFSPDGRLLITEGARGTLLWDASTGRERDRLNLDSARSLSFSADGRRLATAVHTLAQVSDVDSGRELAEIPHAAPLHSIALSSDGRHLATGAGTAAHVWDLGTGRELAQMPHDKPPASVQLSPDGRLLATGTTVARSSWTPTAVHLWDVGSGRELARFGHSCWVDQIVFSPDGRRLATDSNGTLHLWDLGGRRELARMQFVTTELVFSPDGRWLAAGFGRNLHVWDADAGHQLACLAHEGEVSSVAVDRDGRRMGTAAHARTDRASDLSLVMAQVWLKDVPSVENLTRRPSSSGNI